MTGFRLRIAEMVIMEQILEGAAPRTVGDVELRLGSIASHAGFDYFAYVGGKAFNPFKRGHAIWQEPPVMMLTFPPDWVRLYHESDYSRVDPVIDRVLNHRLPVAWDIEVLRNDIGIEQRDFVRAAHDFGVCRGLSIPIYGALGDFGMLTLISSESGEKFQKTIKRYRHELHVAAIHLDQQIRPVAADVRPPAALTEREIEVLTWTAAGKTSPEIAMILAISKKTVDFHLYNAMRKLNVFTKPQAVARALICGLINP